MSIPEGSISMDETTKQVAARDEKSPGAAVEGVYRREETTARGIRMGNLVSDALRSLEAGAMTADAVRTAVNQQLDNDIAAIEQKPRDRQAAMEAEKDPSREPDKNEDMIACRRCGESFNLEAAPSREIGQYGTSKRKAYGCPQCGAGQYSDRSTGIEGTDSDISNLDIRDSRESRA